MSASATSRRLRRKTLAVRVGLLTIGGGSPISVQSMTKTRTDDVRATVSQIRKLQKAGCELVRLAVPDRAAADALPDIRSRLGIALCADIHFDHRLALAAIAAGFDKVRINPGNIGARWKVEEIIRAASDRGTAVRVGVNAGSVEKSVLRKHGHPTPAAMVESMDICLEPFEKLRFRNLVLSAKTTSTLGTIDVYRALSRRYRYPLHLGLTEAGLPFEGAIRSAAALSVLLLEGIGDTVRISLTGEPAAEVTAARELLSALELRQPGPVVYSCPTCGRTRARVVELTRQVSRAVSRLDQPCKIAVMGCVVNGPGEAREADFGIACGTGRGVVFAHGRVVKTCAESELVSALVQEVRKSR